MDQQTDQPTAERESYATPEVTDYGTLQELTAGNSHGSGDFPFGGHRSGGGGGKLS